MKKERSFRPDKVGTTILHKLYISPSQRKTILKWSLYSLMLVLISVIQDVMLSNVRVLGATTELVPCGIFLICLLEGSEKGSLFLLLSACVYVFSGSAAGNHCIVFITVFGLLATILRQYYLQKGLPAAMICVLGAMALYELGVFGIALFFSQTHWGRILIAPMTAILSVIAVPVLYPVCCAIGKIGGGESWKE